MESPPHLITFLEQNNLTLAELTTEQLKAFMRQSPVLSHSEEERIFAGMSNLQTALLMLTTISRQIILNQVIYSTILTKETVGISPDTRRDLAKMMEDDLKRLAVLADVARIIAKIE